MEHLALCYIKNLIQTKSIFRHLSSSYPRCSTQTSRMPNNSETPRAIKRLLSRRPYIQAVLQIRKVHELWPFFKFISRILNNHPYGLSHAESSRYQILPPAISPTRCLFPRPSSYQLAASNRSQSLIRLDIFVPTLFSAVSATVSSRRYSCHQPSLNVQTETVIDSRNPSA